MDEVKKLRKNVIKEFSSEASLKEYGGVVHAGLWDSEKILIKKYFKKGKVLDLGCGTGRTTLPLKKMGYDVIGVDLTPKFIDIAKKSSKGIKFEVGDATQLKFKNEIFDNVLFSFNGIMQIPGKDNREKAFREIYRVLKKGGSFIFTTDYKRLRKFHIWSKRAIEHYVLKHFGYKSESIDFGDMFFKRSGSDLNQFMHIPNLRKIKFLLKQIGFEVVLMEYVSNISSKDYQMKSANCVFYVCKKI
jgi:ubiquinone/menaquinone biosynthesis C-methylase UbiE